MGLFLMMEFLFFPFTFTHTLCVSQERDKCIWKKEPGRGSWFQSQQLVSDSAAHVTLPRAMACILGTWLHLYPEDFQQSPEFPCLKMLLAYIELNMPRSELEQQVRHLLAQLETLEPTEAEGHGEEYSGWVKRTGTNKEGRGLGHTEQSLLRLELGQEH